MIGGVLFPAGGLLGGFVPPELSPAQKRGSGAPQSQGSIEAAGEVELEKSAACTLHVLLIQHIANNIAVIFFFIYYSFAFVKYIIYAQQLCILTQL